MQAANTGRSPIVAPELSALIGSSRANELVASEFVPRDLERKALAHDEAALNATIDSASSELKIRQARMPLLDNAIKLRQDRFGSLKTLASTGTILKFQSSSRRKASFWTSKIESKKRSRPSTRRKAGLTTRASSSKRSKTRRPSIP